MSTTFTLDSIREAAEAKYGNMVITLNDGFEVELVNALRLPKAKRDALLETQNKLEDDNADQEAVFAEIVRVVASNETAANRLLEEVGNDLTILVSIFESYGKLTQVGEA